MYRENQTVTSYTSFGYTYICDYVLKMSIICMLTSRSSMSIAVLCKGLFSVCLKKVLLKAFCDAVNLLVRDQSFLSLHKGSTSASCSRNRIEHSW